MESKSLRIAISQKNLKVAESFTYLECEEISLQQSLSDELYTACTHPPLKSMCVKTTVIGSYFTVPASQRGILVTRRILAEQ